MNVICFPAIPWKFNFLFKYYLFPRFTSSQHQKLNIIGFSVVLTRVKAFVYCWSASSMQQKQYFTCYHYPFNDKPKFGVNAIFQYFTVLTLLLYEYTNSWFIMRYMCNIINFILPYSVNFQLPRNAYLLIFWLYQVVKMYKFILSFILNGLSNYTIIRQLRVQRMAVRYWGTALSLLIE